MTVQRALESFWSSHLASAREEILDLGHFCHWSVAFCIPFCVGSLVTKFSPAWSHRAT